MKRDSTREIAKTETTTAGIWRKMFPLAPGTKNSGMNAAMFVRTAKVTGVAISFAPSMAACKGGSPACRRSKMFSPTMIASSTTMPRVTMNAKRDTMLMEAFVAGNTRNEPTTEMRMPTVTQKATRGCRKRPSRSSTRPRPSRALRPSRSSRSL